jgi:LuxR family transcriptional regulator, maltose regulon positive regulatory protein
LRTEGRLIELGTEDMRLNAREALELLRGAGVEASSADAAELTARAEGWPAGLYLAALACRDHGQVLATFEGADNFVGDYFQTEDLRRLDQDDLTFLMHASVLERLSGVVCDAVRHSPQSCYARSYAG